MPRVKVDVKGKKNNNQTRGYFTYDVFESVEVDENNVILPLTSGDESRIIKTGASTEYRIVEFYISRLNQQPELPDRTPKANERLIKYNVTNAPPAIDAAQNAILYTTYGKYIFAKTRQDVDTKGLDFQSSPYILDR